jgi:hypothetical protein
MPREKNIGLVEPVQQDAYEEGSEHIGKIVDGAD